jgi:hypothetical protein
MLGAGAGDEALLGRVLQSAFAGGKFAAVGLEAGRPTVGALQQAVSLQLFKVTPYRLLRDPGLTRGIGGAQAAASIQFLDKPAMTVNGKHWDVGKCRF